MPTLHSGPRGPRHRQTLCHRELGMTLICWLLTGTLPLQAKGCPAPLLARCGCTDTGQFTSTEGHANPEPRCCGAASGHSVKVCSALTPTMPPSYHTTATKDVSCSSKHLVSHLRALALLSLQPAISPQVFTGPSGLHPICLLRTAPPDHQAKAAGPHHHQGPTTTFGFCCSL